MNFPAQQLYTFDQSYSFYNGNSLEYLQLLNNSEEASLVQMANNYLPVQKSNENSQFVPTFDPNCQAYISQIPQQVNSSLYSIPLNGNVPVNFSNYANYTNNENFIDSGSFYMGYHPDYYRTSLMNVNMNHMRTFLPQAIISSSVKQIGLMNNIQSTNSVDSINNNVSNIESSKVETIKTTTTSNEISEKRVIQKYHDKIESHKSNETFRKTFKSSRNKSKFMMTLRPSLSTTTETITNSHSLEGEPNKIKTFDHHKIVSSSTENSEDFTEPYSTIRSQFIELLVTNLDYNISAKEWKKLLLNQFQSSVKHVHSVLIQTQTDGSNCGIVRVGTMEDARLAISQFHRKKIGYKRIQVNLMNNSNGSSSLINIKQEVATLLKSVAGYSLSVYKFIEMYEKRYHRNICISDFYKMKDFVEIKDVGGHQNWKIISLTNNAINSTSRIADTSESIEKVESVVCLEHCKEGSEEYKIALNSAILPNAEIRLKLLKSQIHKLLQSHNGIIPLLSFLCCYRNEFYDMKIMNSIIISTSTVDQMESEMSNNVQNVNKNIVVNKSVDSSKNIIPTKDLSISEGVPIEHLLNCINEIKLVTTNSGIRQIQLEDKKGTYSQSNNGLGRILVDRLHQFSREVVDLMKHQPSCRIFLSKFIPTYHHHFGKQCRVADYGFSKLDELIEAIPQVVHVIGTGYLRLLYLSHKVQIRRFTNELMKVLKSKNTKSCKLSEYSALYKILFHKDFHITDYGVCFLEDLLNEIPDTTVEVISHEDDTYISMPKRIQTGEEKERTLQFAIEIVDLLKQSPRCRLPFNKFIPSYHHHFGKQCKVTEYGFTKLIELLEAIPLIIQIVEEHGEKYVVLTQKEMLRALGEQTLNILEKSFNKRVQLSEFSNCYLKNKGYMLSLEDFDVSSLEQLIEKIPKIAKLQTFSNFSTNSKTRIYNSSLESKENISMNDTDNQETVIERNDLFICLADRNHVKYMAHKVLLILLEVPSGSLMDYQFCEKYRQNYREEPNLVLIRNEMLDVIQIINDSSLLPYPGSSAFQIRLKSLILFSRDLKDLMRFNQCKMPLMQLESFYEKHFGAPLKSQNYGFPTIFTLIQACDFVVTIKGRGVRACLILCQDFVGKLAYRIAYNTQPTFSTEIEDNTDKSETSYIVNKNLNQGEKNLGNSSNIVAINKQISPTRNENISPCALQSVYNHSIYPQNHFLSPINNYPYFNAPTMFNPWFRQWYQPQPSYGYTPNLYSHPEFGMLSITQSTISSVPGSQQTCVPYASASQDQKQIDELVETLAYDNSCSSNLTIPPVTTFQQIHSEASGTIINNPWIIYPSQQIITNNSVASGYVKTVSNGDNDDSELSIKILSNESQANHQCTNNNNTCIIIAKSMRKMCCFRKFSPSKQMLTKIR